MSKGGLDCVECAGCVELSSIGPFGLLLCSAMLSPDAFFGNRFDLRWGV